MDLLYLSELRLFSDSKQDNSLVPEIFVRVNDLLADVKEHDRIVIVILHRKRALHDQQVSVIIPLVVYRKF